MSNEPSDAAPAVPQVAAAKQLVKTPPGSTLNLTIPADVQQSDIVLAATGRLRIDNRARVIGGHVVNTSQRELSTGIDTVLRETRTSSIGNLEVDSPHDPNAWIEGPIRTAGFVYGRNTQISGPVTQHASIALQTLTRSAVFPPSGPDKTVAASAQLTPGSYGNVLVLCSSTLTLQPGTYYFKSLEVSEGSKVVLKNAAAPVLVNVQDRVSPNGEFVEEASGIAAGNFMLTQWSDRPITIAGPWRGTLVAPRAQLTIKSLAAGREHRGAFFGETIHLIPGAVVRYQPFPSYLIDRVDVSTLTPCANEPLKVVVRMQPSDADTTSGVLVSIDGKPAVFENGIASAWLQLFGTGTRRVTVTAKRGGATEVKTVELTPQTCAQQKYPRVVLTPTNTPYEVELTVTNADELAGANRKFFWTFGDGQSAETSQPNVRHSYVESLDRNTPELKFESVLRVQRDGVADVSVSKTVVLPNMYAYAAARGFVQPIVSTPGELEPVGGTFVGSFSIRNLEPAPITFSQRVLRKHFCDPDRDPIELPPEAISLTLPAADVVDQQLELDRHDYRDDVCGVSLYLRGRTADNLAAIVTAHFATPARSLLTKPVTDASLRDLLNRVTGEGLVSDSDRVTQDDLHRLKAEGRIDAVPEIADQLEGVLAGSDDLIGQPCEPGAVSEFPNISCEATDDWTVTPPLVMNALKGDLIIVSSCETIGGLLRSVKPRQFYSHEGIFTRNYYALAESTAAEGRILGSVDGVGSQLNGEKLKFAWPGGLRQSISTAFGGLRKRDPEGKLQLIETFHPEAAHCAKDSMPSPSLIIHPPASEEAHVRNALHATADFAFTSNTHYRFFGFSQANIAFPRDRNFDGNDYRAPNGEPATVSTSFLWHSLRSTNVPLEGDVLEPLLRGYFHFDNETDEVALGAELPPSTAVGERDGLYRYTESERKAGATFIYNSTRDAVARLQNQASYDVLGWSADVTAPMLLFLTEGDPGARGAQQDRIAGQFTNCFGFDMCGASGEPSCPCTYTPASDDSPATETCPANMTARQHAACDTTYGLSHPGEGMAVSPDNFLFWDAPNYGYWEVAAYRSGVFRRVHVWKAAEGSTGTCGGTVTLEDGTPVEGARVIVQDATAGTDADGNFQFSALAAGQHDVRAEKEIDGVLHWDSVLVDIPSDGACNPPALVLTADGPFADMKPVSVMQRRVTLRGNLHLHDDEIGSDENADFPIDTECLVGPTSSHILLKSHDLTGSDNPCAGDEVRGAVEVSCRLDPDDLTFQRVIVTATVSIVEGNDCFGGGDIFDDPEAASDSSGPTTLSPGETISASASARVEGGDRGTLTLTISSDDGPTIVINPIKEEFRRKVRFEGSVAILDDDFLSPNDKETFEFFQECFVDPLNPVDEFSWSECVDEEVRAELHVKCSLVADNAKKVTVSTTATLFEETTCLNNDQDGRVVRFTPPLPAFEDDPSEIFLNSPEDGEDLVVKNEDEGGDKATFKIRMKNLQQSAQ